MILNALSITMIFIGALSALLAIWGGISSLILYRKWKRTATPEEKTSLEDRSYLVLLIMVIVLLIRLINWPLFYVTLQSFISDIEGAMCIFGVTQVKVGLTRFLEFLKPTNFFLIGGWLMLHVLDRATKTSPLMRKKLLLLSIISLFVLIDSMGDIFLMIGIAPESLVSCCTTVTDILNRPTRTTPESIFGPEYAQSLQVLFFITHLALMGFIGVTLKFRIFRRLILGLLSLFAVLNAFVFLLSQIEVFAPRMMHLPFHHCLYCLWQYVPDSIVMFLLFILGTFSVGWGFTTELFGRQGEAADLLPGYLRKIYWFAFFFLSAFLIMLIIHLLVD
ncbi:MAG: hypothetical protein COS40_02860 [Deltaproteobacteria bacterium CG03_land_8_20_14_0_80_45_14]|nr:MAG: hypothetical protein COS40_02860 [Deltaproteobacteria bacterium CG03_land_8_20_14_0_80_45_14]